MRIALLVTIVFASICISHCLPVEHPVSKKTDNAEDLPVRPDILKIGGAPDEKDDKDEWSAPMQPSALFELLSPNYRRQLQPQIKSNKSQKEKSTELNMALAMDDGESDAILLQILKSLGKTTRNDPVLYPARNENNLNPQYSAIRIKSIGDSSAVSQPQSGVRRRWMVVGNPNVNLKQLQDVEITLRVSKDFTEKVARFLEWFDKKVCEMEGLLYQLVWFGLLIFCAFICVVLFLLIVLACPPTGKPEPRPKRLECQKAAVIV